MTANTTQAAECLSRLTAELGTGIAMNLGYCAFLAVEMNDELPS